MKLSRGHWALILLTIGYLAVFTAYYISIRNFEFLWYVVVVVVFALLIASTLNASRLPVWLLSLLSLWGFLHMAGGGIKIGDHVLYSQILFPLINTGEWGIIKYDQMVHAFGFGVTAIVFYYLVGRKTGNMIPPLWLGLLAVSVSMGMGALNEIIEFIATTIVPSTGVGGYANTSLDLVANLIGASIATVLYVALQKIKRPA